MQNPICGVHNSVKRTLAAFLFPFALVIFVVRHFVCRLSLYSANNANPPLERRW